MQRRQNPFDPFSSLGFPSLFDDPSFSRHFAQSPFSHDPFLSDPFFTQPFGASMFGNRPSLLDRGFPPLQPFTPSPFPLMGPPLSFQQPQFQPQQHQVVYPPPAPQVQEVYPSPAPQVQEVDPAEGGSHSVHGEPIVEDPDDQEEEEEPGQQQRHGCHQSHTQRTQPDPRRQGSVGQAQQHQTIQSSAPPAAGGPGWMAGGGGWMGSAVTSSSSSFVFQSTTMSGAGGVQYYSSSSSRRVGPGGVVEEQHTERDSSGKESMTLTRGIQDKGRTLMRSRRGREDSSTEILHNITPEEAHTFDATWQQHASSLAGPYQGGGYPTRPALPASGSTAAQQPAAKRRTSRRS